MYHLFGGDAGPADLGQVQKGAAHALCVQAGAGAHIERGLAELAGVEDVAVLAAGQPGQQVGVGLAGDVGKGLGRQGAAGDIEGHARRGPQGSISQSSIGHGRPQELEQIPSRRADPEQKNRPGAEERTRTGADEERNEEKNRRSNKLQR